MEINTTMIVMKVDMDTKMITAVDMGGREIFGMAMIGILIMEAHMAVKGIGMVGITRTVIIETALGMMTIEEEVKGLTNMLMGQEVEVLIQARTVLMKMMASILLGLFILSSKSQFKLCGLFFRNGVTSRIQYGHDGLYYSREKLC